MSTFIIRFIPSLHQTSCARGASPVFEAIRWCEGDRLELYNVAEDIGGQNDLGGRQPRRVRQMKRKLDNWLENVNARMPLSNPAYKKACISRRATLGVDTFSKRIQ